MDDVYIFHVSFRNHIRNIKVNNLSDLFPRIEKQFCSCPGFGNIYRVQGFDEAMDVWCGKILLMKDN